MYSDDLLLAGDLAYKSYQLQYIVQKQEHVGLIKPGANGCLIYWVSAGNFVFINWQYVYTT